MRCREQTGDDARPTPARDCYLLLFSNVASIIIHDPEARSDTYKKAGRIPRRRYRVVMSVSEIRRRDCGGELKKGSFLLQRQRKQSIKCQSGFHSGVLLISSSHPQHQQHTRLYSRKKDPSLPLKAVVGQPPISTCLGLSHLSAAVPLLRRCSLFSRSPSLSLFLLSFCHSCCLCFHALPLSRLV